MSQRPQLSEQEQRKMELFGHYHSSMKAWSFEQLEDFRTLFEAFEKVKDEPLTPQALVNSAGFWFGMAWAELARHIHETALAKGFWHEGNQRNKGELIALMHSELSEALEALRHGNPPDNHIPQFSGVEAELADLIIRVMDAAKMFGWDVPGALVAKTGYNKDRPPMHGKQF